MIPVYWGGDSTHRSHIGTHGQLQASLPRAEKGFTYGTHRSCPPAETWARIQPHFAKTGLTRVADITGLDRVGIPVTLAFRPDSPTMANSTGKGLTLEAALVSGAMEAMELYHAEHVELPVLRHTYEEMARRGTVLDVDDLALIRHSVFHVHAPDYWVYGPNLRGGDDIAVPLALVALWDPLLNESDYILSFQMGSNGLASGNHLPEAIISALLEVIERDAITSHTVADRSTRRPPPRVGLETIPSSLVQELLERLQQADITPILYDCGTDTAVPVYMCHLYDNVSRNMGIYGGYGAHLDPEIAILRAVTEAAQARAVVIAGSRDDIFRRDLYQSHMIDTRQQLDAFARIPATVDASERMSEATDTFEGDLAILLDKLERVDLRQVIAFDLSQADFPFAVARVVVPGLEGFLFNHYTPGRRALALARRRELEAV